MRSVGIKRLKNKLSEYVKLAAGGEVVLICDRDRVVAELGPASPTRAETVADARLAGWIREGLVRPAIQRGAPPPPPPGVAPVQTLLEELDRDRGNR